jgi:hypothetical protein
MAKNRANPPAEKQEPERPGKDEPDTPFPVHAHIGRQLRAIFDEVVTQPVPDRFRELLEQLERKQSKD